MADPYIGQISTFGGNFAPRGWSTCAGQLLAISSYSSLFSILGTTYGGDGISTFGLPDLRGRVAIGDGQGPGLSNYNLGQKGGSESVKLTISQTPSHKHSYNASTNTTESGSPTGNSLPTLTSGQTPYATVAPDTAMSSGSVSNTGSSQSHTNIQPYLVITRIIALEGVFPSRS
jgi:microcystin-dependent protein